MTVAESWSASSPCLIRNRSAASWPLCAAVNSGEMPYTLVKLSLAPAFSSISPISTLSRHMASCSAVQPNKQWVLTAAPWFSSAATRAALFTSQAVQWDRQESTWLRQTLNSLKVDLLYPHYLGKVEFPCPCWARQGQLRFPTVPEHSPSAPC